MRACFISWICCVLLDPRVVLVWLVHLMGCFVFSLLLYLHISCRFVVQAISMSTYWTLRRKVGYPSRSYGLTKIQFWFHSLLNTRPASRAHKEHTDRRTNTIYHLLSRTYSHTGRIRSPYSHHCHSSRCRGDIVKEVSSRCVCDLARVG